jgi:hypothetical protein
MTFKVTYTNKAGEIRTERYKDLMSAHIAVARHQEFGDWGGYNPKVNIEREGA